MVATPQHPLLSPPTDTSIHSLLGLLCKVLLLLLIKLPVVNHLFANTLVCRRNDLCGHGDVITHRPQENNHSTSATPAIAAICGMVNDKLRGHVDAYGGHEVLQDAVYVADELGDWRAQRP